MTAPASPLALEIIIYATDIMAEQNMTVLMTIVPSAIAIHRNVTVTTVMIASISVIDAIVLTGARTETTDASRPPAPV